MKGIETPRKIATPPAAAGRSRAGTRTSDRVDNEPVAAIRDLRSPPGASRPENELEEQERGHRRGDLETGDITTGREHISRHAQRALEQGPALRAEHPGHFTE